MAPTPDDSGLGPAIAIACIIIGMIVILAL